jgi:acetylornithine deacetylase/succinyl-diaminopimelate desuccinylase-like protein
MKTGPQRAMARSISYWPDQDPDEIVEQLRAHLDRQGFSDCVITKLGGEQAFQTDLSDPFVRMVVEAARIATGREVVLVPTSAGTGPMYDVGGPLGIPILSIGAGYRGSNAHAQRAHPAADFGDRGDDRARARAFA